MKTTWQIKKLGDVCSIGAGNSAPQKKEFFTGGQYPFFRTSDVGTIHVGTIEKSNDYLNENGIKRMRLFERGTLLFPKSGASTFLNHRVTMAVDGYVSSHLATIKANAGGSLEDGFLFYFSMNIDSRDLMQDQNYPSLRLSDIENIEISLPSVEEQKRIVKKLDRVFEKVTKTKENAEKNLQNSRELFESYLQSVFANPGNDWKQTYLGDEMEILAGFAFKSAKYTEKSEDIRLLRGDNIITSAIRWTDVKRWSMKDIFAYHNYRLEIGDIVLAMDRPWIKSGLKHAMIAEEDLPCLLVQRVARIRPKVNLDNRFLMFLIGSKNFTKHIIGIQTGVGVPHISGKQIKDFTFELPPIEEQKAIAEKLDSLSIEMKKLEKIYYQKLTNLEELKKTVLQQAFTGKL